MGDRLNGVRRFIHGPAVRGWRAVRPNLPGRVASSIRGPVKGVMHGAGLLVIPRGLDAFDGRCALCGKPSRFVKTERPPRESYACGLCGATLRYQGQARVILQCCSRRGSTSIAEVVREPEFRALHIWEPGESGFFRSYFNRLPHCQLSAYWPDVLSGELRDGVRCEDLMATTFPSESFDLIVTSDIFEHVRKPDRGFQEIYRVLRPGGAHVFSLPVTAPTPPTTVARVDTSGTDDVFLLEPYYHGTHLVYNDFGADLLELLEEIGFVASTVQFESPNANASRLLTFCTVKPASP